MTRNFKLNTGIHNQHIIKEPGGGVRKSYATIYYSSADQTIKTPSGPFTGHPYAQRKGMIAVLIAGCSCSHWQKVALLCSYKYGVLILRQWKSTIACANECAPHVGTGS